MLRIFYSPNKYITTQNHPPPQAGSLVTFLPVQKKLPAGGITPFSPVRKYNGFPFDGDCHNQSADWFRNDTEKQIATVCKQASHRRSHCVVYFHHRFVKLKR